MLNLIEVRAAWSRGSRPGPVIHALCDEQEDEQRRRHALEVELAASNCQRREQDQKLDAATLTIEILKEDL